MSSLKKLDALRAPIATLVAEREEIESAPISRADAEALIDRVIAAPFSDTVINPGPNGHFDADPAPSGLLEQSARPRKLATSGRHHREADQRRRALRIVVGSRAERFGQHLDPLRKALAKA